MRFGFELKWRHVICDIVRHALYLTTTKTMCDVRTFVVHMQNDGECASLFWWQCGIVAPCLNARKMICERIYAMVASRNSQIRNRRKFMFAPCVLSRPILILNKRQRFANLFHLHFLRSLEHTKDVLEKYIDFFFFASHNAKFSKIIGLARANAKINF